MVLVCLSIFSSMIRWLLMMWWFQPIPKILASGDCSFQICLINQGLTWLNHTYPYVCRYPICKPWCWHIYIFTLILRVPVGNSVRGAVELGFLRFDMWNSADPWQSHNAKSNLGTNKNKTTRPTSWKNTQIYSSTGPIYHDLPILFIFFTRLVYIYMCVF